MPWQMLLSYDVVVCVITTEDVITSIWQGGRCYCLVVNVVDVQTTSCYNILVWQILLPRCQME